jgi:hypothetical protein
MSSHDIVSCASSSFPCIRMGWGQYSALIEGPDFYAGVPVMSPGGGHLLTRFQSRPFLTWVVGSEARRLTSSMSR